MCIFIEDFILESCLHNRCCSHGLEPTPKARDIEMMTAKSNDYYIWSLQPPQNCLWRGTSGDRDPRRWREGKLYRMQNCHHQNDFCIKMGSD